MNRFFAFIVMTLLVLVSVWTTDMKNVIAQSGELGAVLPLNKTMATPLLSVAPRHIQKAIGNNAYQMSSIATSNVATSTMSISIKPMLLGTYTVPSPYGEAMGVAISGGYAYIVSTSTAYGLSVFDIKKNVPTLVAYTDKVGSSEDIYIKGTYAYIAGQKGLTIAAITNPLKPELLSTLALSGPTTDVLVNGNYAYLVGDTTGLSIVDITDPKTPTLKKYIYQPGSYKITIDGGRLYLNNYSLNSFSVFDIKNPINPTLLGSYGRTSFAPVPSVIRGNYAYVGNWFHQLEVLDIANPSDIKVVGQTGTLGINPYDMALVGDYVYAPAGYYAQFFVFDVKDPYNIKVAYQLNTPGYAVGLEFIDDKSFIVLSTNALQKWSVAKKAVPIMVVPQSYSPSPAPLEMM